MWGRTWAACRDVRILLQLLASALVLQGETCWSTAEQDHAQPSL